MRGFYFREATDRLVQSFLPPYFLVPAVIAVAIYLVHPLETTIATGMSSIQVAFASATFAVCLVSAASGARFFSKFWGESWFGSSLMAPVSRIAGFWQVVLAQMLFSSVILVLSWGAVAAAMPAGFGPHLVPVACAGIALAAWTAAVSAMAGLLTTPAPASVLAGAFTLYSLAPLVDPLDSLFSPAFRMTGAAMPSALAGHWPTSGAILIILGQAAGFAAAAFCLYFLAMHRGVDTHR
ncbi:MAG: hypothetical protein QUS11_06900 [Candidatus Fermentibacter sp.]|nr:hypothetical protein [Candidatus Fermentibacter sp.]